jgi:hypothetical protein
VRGGVGDDAEIRAAPPIMESGEPLEALRRR